MGLHLGGPAATTLGIRTPYLGPVATRGRIPSGVVASSIYKQTMAWSRHQATDDITALALLFTSINGTAETSTSAGPGTAKASVEYPAGTITPVTFAAATSGTIPANDILVSDLTTLTTAIPAGATFWIGTYVNWTGTNTPVMMDSLTSLVPATATSRESTSASTTTTTDTTLTGTRAIAGINPRDTYRPSAILAMTRKPTFFLAGDSRTRGALGWDLNVDAQGLSGLTEQVLGARWGYINAGVNTDSYTLANTGSNYAKRLTLSGYCSHILDDYGINSVWADTTAVHQAAVSTFRAKFPASKPYFKTTLIPQLTAASTQIAADASDQTPLSTLQKYIDNNNWVRQGASGLIDGYIELEDLVSYKRDSGKFRPAERRVTDAAITSGSNILTSATGAFTSADVNKPVHILGAGASGAALYAIISAVTNSTTVTLKQSNQVGSVLNASTTVSGASAGIGVYSAENTHQASGLETIIRDSAAWRRLTTAK